MTDRPLSSSPQVSGPVAWRWRRTNDGDLSWTLTSIEPTAPPSWHARNEVQPLFAHPAPVSGESVERIAAFLKIRDEAFIMDEEQTDAERLESARAIVALSAPVSSDEGWRAGRDAAAQLVEEALGPLVAMGLMAGMSGDDEGQATAGKVAEALGVVASEIRALPAPKTGGEV